MATANSVTTIKVKSPAALAAVIAWTQSDFYPTSESASAKTDEAETVSFTKLDGDELASNA